MKDFFQYAADIIRAAAESPFGILALIILVLGVLAYFFFVNASERTRAGIFLIIFAAGCTFGAAVLRRAQSEADAKARDAAVASIAASRTPPAQVSAPSASAPAPPAAVPREDWNDPQWGEARDNIRWVLQQDPGGKRTYDNARSRGLSKYLAVLAAQGHNLNAQRTIAAYGEVRAERFINSLGH